jgi:DNA-binding transcriptional regulator YiaG
MQAVIDSRFRQIRESLFVSREDITRRTKSVSVGTLRNAERGRPVRRTTAHQLLGAINALLREAEKEPLSLEELGLNVESTVSQN